MEKKKLKSLHCLFKKHILTCPLCTPRSPGSEAPFRFDIGWNSPGISLCRHPGEKKTFCIFFNLKLCFSGKAFQDLVAKRFKIVGRLPKYYYLCSKL